jgi:hypothetical protein
MKREQLLRLLRREARKAKVEFRVEKAEGKGSHYRVYLGSRVTTIKSGELKPGYVKLVCRQLGLE